MNAYLSTRWFIFCKTSNQSNSMKEVYSKIIFCSKSKYDWFCESYQELVIPILSSVLHTFIVSLLDERETTVNLGGKLGESDEFLSHN